MASKKTKHSQLAGLRFFCLSIIAGLALCLPFLHYNLGWLIFLALIPFLFLLKLINESSLRKGSKVGYIWLSGWVMMSGVVFWLLQTQPDRWAGLSGWWAMGSLLVVFLLFSAILSFGFIFFGLGWVFMKLNLTQKRIFILLPALWIVCEFLRSWLFSLIATGPNTVLGANWNFGNLGFAASVSPLVFLARIGGLYGLSFAVIVINLSIFWIIQKRWKLPLILLLSIGLITTGAYFGYKQTDGKQIGVAALQLGKNQSLQIGSIGYHNQLSEIPIQNQADIIVLPEYSTIFEGENEPTDSVFIHQLSNSSQTPIITSLQRSETEKLFNTVTVYNPNKDVVFSYDKQFLIPVGEAMPYALSKPLELFGQGAGLKLREITRGNAPATTFVANGLAIGSQACSGAISPELYRELVNGGAQILTNSASLSIFADSPTYHQQAQQMARFMAVSNARPFAQATDGSYSFVIDSNGRWLAKSGQDNLQLIHTNVTTNTRRTFYSRLGEWVIWASVLILVGYSILLWKQPKK